MEQVKTKRVKKDPPKFDVGSIQWNRYKKISTPVSNSVAIIVGEGSMDADYLKEAIVDAAEEAIDAAIKGLIRRYPECTDVKVSYYYSTIQATGKNPETQKKFERRVIEELRTEWVTKENESKNAESNRKKDLAAYERIKAKYKL